MLRGKRTAGVRLLMFVTVMVAMATAAGCGGSSSTNGDGSASIFTGGTPGGTPVRGGTLVFARSVEPASLDPLAMTDPGSEWVNWQIFDQLVEYLPGAWVPRPGLATSWTVSDDARAFDFVLRRGVKFSNGDPVTAEDAAYSIKRLTSPINANASILGKTLKSVTVTGPDSIHVELTKSTPAFLYYLGGVQASIVPKHMLERIGEKRFAEAPIGSGPFAVKRWQRGKSLDLARNPHYWRSGQPYLDGISFRLTPDSNARILAVRSGQADLADNVPFSQIASLQHVPNATPLIERLAAVSTEIFNDGKAPFSDVHVRKALNYATPREQIVKAVYRGYAEVANSAIPKTSEWDPDVKPFPYDLAKARAELKSSSEPDGFSMTIGIASGDPDVKLIATILQDSWGRIGVRARIAQTDFGTLATKYFAGDYEFDVFPSDAFATDMPVPDVIGGLLYDYGNGHAAGSNYNSPQAIALTARATTTADPAERRQLWSKLQRLTYTTDAAFLPLGFLPARTLAGKRVHGFETLQSGNWRMERVFLR